MMRNGRIVADGSKAELLTAERLSELFGAQVQVTERDGFFHAW
jgi:iron complex transport system ATP-binding protein